MRKLYNSNTTFVKVKSLVDVDTDVQQTNSNTTFVKVKLR